PAPEAKPVAKAATPEPTTAKVPDMDIHEATADENIEVVKQHLAARTDVNAKDRLGFTPLHRTSIKEIVELLITNGADVNAKGKYGRTPLLIAAYQGHKEVAELFIAKGADVNAKVDDGKTPLDRAGLSKQTEITDLLHKHSGISGAADSVQVATSVGNIEAVKQHLTDGVDINARDSNQMTPLFHAVGNEKMAVTEFLIKEGAEINTYDNQWKTPLDYAIELKHAELTNLLLKNGAKTSEEMNTDRKEKGII
ncbi:ankyrin repeat domain-containing protein, partial [bacterium]|nr:ankyrin repeat domain-containing protein [bacterium]